MTAFRFTLTVIGFGVTLAHAASPTKGVVTALEVEVHGGASSTFPAVGRLKRGDEISILDDANGWLKIVPPPRSFSWINDRAIQFVDEPNAAPGRPRIAHVLLDHAPVRLGSDRSREPLAVEPVQLQRGTLVRVIGEKVLSDNSTWWPIEPTAAEVRYLPREAVAVSTDSPVAARKDETPSPPPSPGSEPLLWAQAQQAEQAGNFGQAEQLYAQLARKMSQPGGDPDLAIRCYNRIQAIRERLQNRIPPLTTEPTRSDAPPTPANTAPAYPARNVALQSSGPGWLRSAGGPIDGKPAFVVMDERGFPRLYVTAGPGVDLTSYLNRQVELFGPMVYRGDVRGGNYMVVQRVHLLR